MMAMRGASPCWPAACAGGRRARRRACRRRRPSGWRPARVDFEQLACRRGLRRPARRRSGTTTSCALAARAVDDGDGLAAGRRFGGRLLRCLGRVGRRGRRAVIAGMRGGIAGVFGFHRGRRIGGDRDHRHRLAAERIVDEQRPAQHGKAEQTEQARQHCGAPIGSLGLGLVFVLAERGVQVIRCHGRDPRESGRAVYHARLVNFADAGRKCRQGGL